MLCQISRDVEYCVIVALMRMLMLGWAWIRVLGCAVLRAGADVMVLTRADGFWILAVYICARGAGMCASMQVCMQVPYHAIRYDAMTRNPLRKLPCFLACLLPAPLLSP